MNALRIDTNGFSEKINLKSSENQNMMVYGTSFYVDGIDGVQGL